MKKFVCFLLLSILLAAASAQAQGTWDLSGDTQPSQAAQEVFSRAVDGLLGVRYELVASLGEKPDDGGTLYCFLCRLTVVYPDAVPEYDLMYVFSDANGDVRMVQLTGLEIGYDADGGDAAGE